MVELPCTEARLRWSLVQELRCTILALAHQCTMAPELQDEMDHEHLCMILLEHQSTLHLLGILRRQRLSLTFMIMELNLPLLLPTTPRRSAICSRILRLR